MRFVSPLLAAALLLPAGCATLPHPVETPAVAVRSVSVYVVSLTGLEGRLNMDVSNPNSFGLPLEGCDWSLSVAGDPAVSGSLDLSQTIPARATAPVVSRIRVDVTQAARVGAHLAAGERHYRLTGTLHFATALGSISVDFEHDGVFDG